MAFRKTIPEKIEAEALKSFYSKNEEDLRSLILYLNNLDTGWRKHQSTFFKTLTELEKELEKKEE